MTEKLAAVFKRFVDGGMKAQAAVDRVLDGSVSGGQQKILDAIATLNGLGVPEPSVVQTALYVGVSHTTGTYLQNLRDLEGLGFLTRSSGKVQLTARAPISEGARGRYHDPISMWKEKLSGSQAKMLDVIVKRYPKEITVKDLASEVGVSPTTGTYLQNIRDMATYGLIDRGKGTVVASEVLFP
jgi:DNA-binding MarR family transcriptional regulator